MKTSELMKPLSALMKMESKGEDKTSPSLQMRKHLREMKKHINSLPQDQQERWNALVDEADGLLGDPDEHDYR